jgi:O-antigen ligase
MTKPPINLSVSKSKALLSLEYALLFLALCVLALRTIYAEGPAVQSTSLPTSVSDQLYSLSISACLLAAFVLWIVWNICSKRFFYRPTGMEIGLALFIIASVISCFAAPDKRLAITNVAVLIAPIFSAVLLIQLLDSQARVNFVLAVVAALGVLCAYQCFEQLFAGNAAMIQQYKENPQSLLGPLGIEPNTLEHFLFEDRLYAQNVRAFFTTRNSAGSFLLLSFFAAFVLYLKNSKNIKSEEILFLRQENTRIAVSNKTKLERFTWRWLRIINVLAITITTLTIYFSKIYRDQEWSFGFVMIVAILITNIIFMKILYYGWMVIQDDYVRTTPGKAVGFLFIPFFNLYWIFVAIGAYAKGFNSFILRNKIPAKRLSEKLFITQCILIILVILIGWVIRYAESISYIKILAIGSLVISIIALVCYIVIILYIKKAADEIYTYTTNLPCQKYRALEIPVTVIFNVLIITESKGAIIGLFFAGFLLAVFIRFRAWLKVHRKAILELCIFIVVASGFTIAWYGLKHNRLPGGNSMLVRWQYWHATAEMIAHHPLTGVGPGNFTAFYSRYKPAAALESISDPHNFLLSILSQYGPLGLVGFLIVMVLPLWKIIFPGASVSSEVIREQPLVFKTNVITTIIVVWVGLLLAQIFIGPAAGSGNIAVPIYIATRFFVPSFVIFTIALLLFRDQFAVDGRAKRNVGKASITTAVIFCALLGVVLHNLTDFAIFEPGVNTTFWTMLACLVAADSFTKPKREIVLTPAPVMKILSIILAIILGGTFLNYALVPVAASTAKIEQANDFISAGRFDQAHRDLDDATALDKFSPVAPSLNARLYLHLYRQEPQNNREMLIQAEQCLKTAIERNKADFKNYDRLSEVYVTLSEITNGQESTDWLDKAFAAASNAVECYPGRGRLHFNLAQIAEKLGKAKVALQQYEDAVDIENQYRGQFHKMFPERKIASRLGEQKYQTALKRIEALKNQQEGDKEPLTK